MQRVVEVSVSFPQANPPDLVHVVHKGLLPGEPLATAPAVVTALRSAGLGVLDWRMLGADHAVEVTVTWTRLMQEAALGLTSGALQGGECRMEGEHDVVEGFFEFTEGAAFLVARLPIEADIPEWAAE